MNKPFTVTAPPAGERGAFDTNHLESVTLPSRYYTDEDIHRRELHAIHYKAWCYIRHVIPDQLNDHG